jgi:hypothetical protein
MLSLLWEPIERFPCSHCAHRPALGEIGFIANPAFRPGAVVHPSLLLIVADPIRREEVGGLGRGPRMAPRSQAR